MGSYQVTCVSREECDHGGHISRVGVTRKQETDLVDVSVVRLMLSSGDTVYVRDSESDERIGLRKGKCGCGVKTVRTDVDDSTALTRLAACS